MVQHVFIKLNEEGNPVAEVPTTNVFRDDQQLMWILNDEVKKAGWGWDNQVNGGDKAIKFDTGWQGSVPAPIGNFIDIMQDTRLYAGTGPGANNGDQSTVFAYHLSFRNIDGRVFPHDPEIGNQPQP
jgi:hypothetical protein